MALQINGVSLELCYNPTYWELWLITPFIFLHFMGKTTKPERINANFHLLQRGAKNKNPKKMVNLFTLLTEEMEGNPFEGAGNWWLEVGRWFFSRMTYFSEANCVGLRGDTVTQTAGHEFVSGNPSKIIGFPYIWTSTLIPPYFWIKFFVIFPGFRCESFGRFFVQQILEKKKTNKWLPKNPMGFHGFAADLVWWQINIS